jgi:hypothetical protein
MLFYKLLAKEVKITATEENDLITVKQLTDGSVAVEIYNTSDNREPYYKRIFSPNETRQIMINGFGGEDVFNVDEHIKGIRISFKNKKIPIPPLRHSS